MTKHRVHITENVMLPLDIQPGTDNGLVLTYTTSAAKEDGNIGHVFIRIIRKDVTTLRLTGKEGDYGPPACALHGDTMWVAHTAYQDKRRSILLHGICKDQKTVSITIRPLAKIDNPNLSVFGDSVHVVWEDYTQGDAHIKHASFSLRALYAGDSSPVKPPFEVSGSKSYKPQLISNGSQLYLFYERFFQGRYRVMARCLMSEKAHFSDPVEIGFETRNDQAVSLAILDGKIVATWENSSPLDKGYEWHSPASEKITIPNFGHGWRVNTKMGLRRVHFKAQTWYLDDLLTRQAIEVQEAAGAARVQVAVGRLYVSYLRFDDGSETKHPGWQICTKVLNDGRWISLDSAGIIQKQRVRPAVLLDTVQGEIHTFGQSPEQEKAAWPVWTQENAATYQCIQSLPELPRASRTIFEARSCEQPAKPASTETAPRIPYSISFEDGSRQLLWGDLHMHSNLSGCSLNTCFHCTELEEKFRFCRDLAQLDFALNTDHDSMGDNEWFRNRNSAHFHDFPGSFIAFNGYEWTCSQHKDKPNYGHYNILYKEDGPLLRTRDPRFDTVLKLKAALPDDATLAIPHHPGDSTHPLDWNAYDAAFAPLVEIFQVRGSYEYDTCPMHPALYGRNVVRDHSLQYGLKRGFDFGFTAGGEHEGVGVTGIYALDFTRQGIFDALCERRTFGTTGARIIVDFRLDQLPMGSCLHTSAQSLTGYISVIGTDILTSIKIIRNGQTCHEWNPNTQQMITTWQEERTGNLLAQDKRDYYYAVVTQHNDEMAWTSPIFVYGK